MPGFRCGQFTAVEILNLHQTKTERKFLENRKREQFNSNEATDSH